MLNIAMPASVNPPGPALAQAFCLKGGMPVQVFSDELGTTDVTSTATISPAEPLGGATSQSLYCVSSVSVTMTIPAGQLRYVTVRLDFQPRGMPGFPSNASSTYVQGFKFIQSGTVNGTQALAGSGTTLDAAGKDVTGHCTIA